MAIVGLRSPFKKKDKESPLKAAWIPLVTAGLNFLSAKSSQRQANRFRRQDQQRV